MYDTVTYDNGQCVLVSDTDENGPRGKKPPKEISMIDVLENLGIKLTSEKKEYFKDKVLTYVDILDDHFIDIADIPDHKITITFNYVRDNSEE